MLSNSIRADDDLLLAAYVKQGNQQYFRLLYDKYAPALFGIISRISNNEKMAEEILNIAFIKVWNQRASFNSSKTSLFSWLMAIARQTAFDEIKSEQAKNLEDNNSVYGITKTHLKDDSLIQGQNQSAFDLVYYKGLTYLEAATKLNMTVAELITNLRMTIKNLD